VTELTIEGGIIRVRKRCGEEGDREGRNGREANLAGFVLCDFMLGVFFAVFAFAVGAAGFRNVDLKWKLALVEYGQDPCETERRLLCRT
jgi:hypothetical protein